MRGVMMLAQTEVAIDEAITGLSTGGWLMMLASIGMVLGLTVFCFYHILRNPGGVGDDSNAAG